MLMRPSATQVEHNNSTQPMLISGVYLCCLYDICLRRFWRCAWFFVLATLNEAQLGSVCSCMLPGIVMTCRDGSNRGNTAGMQPSNQRCTVKQNLSQLPNQALITQSDSTQIILRLSSRCGRGSLAMLAATYLRQFR